jgi:hypothetical protein
MSEPTTPIPPRDWLIARLVGLAIGLPDHALSMLRDFGEGLAVHHERLAERPPQGRIGRVLADVAAEVVRAEGLHPGGFPGGWGWSGTEQDEQAAWEAQAVCAAAQRAGKVTFRQVLEEEVAEVLAERGGSPSHGGELVQVAAVCVRGIVRGEGER